MHLDERQLKVVSAINKLHMHCEHIQLKFNLSKVVSGSCIGRTPMDLHQNTENKIPRDSKRYPYKCPARSPNVLYLVSETVNPKANKHP